MTWWVEWASCCGMGILLWNGHLVVEWASCCGMGILLWNGHLVVEWASCCGMGILLWNGHLARFNFRSGLSQNWLPRK
ncbi:hypothetical protein [Moorena sp. SIO3I8]|uniref:hypothetical protein n=1 Tax=Moorena sp. SIO3I8 TaxID=2607833 RepID=UPI0013C15783|nr:hypothetical protein [Moorena sp. SIO3I8]NEO05005.1 hypothetical protein [Moorena sp. SIO3I8]